MSSSEQLTDAWVTAIVVRTRALPRPSSAQSRAVVDLYLYSADL